MSDLITHSIHCSGCGAPLDVNQNKNGRILCEFCGTTNVVEKFTQNMAILQKQNIESGFELTASKAALHKKIVDILAKPEDAPLDIFEKAEVIKEEHICLPIYAFHVNGTGQFGFEIGFQREKTETYTSGGETRLRTVTYMEWVPNSSAVSCSDMYFAPGTKEYAELFDQFSARLSPSKLVDIESLNFPSDVQCLEYDLSQITSFESYVKPKVEACLKAKAESALSGKTWRNGMMQGSTVMKDEISRLYMQFYHIVYIYGNKNYSLYVLNDGTYAIYDELITDPERTQKIAEQRAAVDAVKPKSKALWTLAMIGSIALGLLLWILIKGGVGFVLFALLLAGGIVLRSIFVKKINKEYNAARDVQLSKLDDIFNEFNTVVNDFKSAKKPLKGIYEFLDGDGEAF